ncbi:unnamed protein product [marine sediment metagenome]|uniref:Uncharacterized protein n=1 Tax=marine sediment metagenome TaxID=412755 RepID=X1ACU8_9ZZZZ
MNGYETMTVEQQIIIIEREISSLMVLVDIKSQELEKLLEEKHENN